MTRAQEPAESGDCTGCRHYHFIPEQRGIGGRKSAGDGCLLTGGHAIKHCTSYQTQEPAELRPGLPPVELRRVWREWITPEAPISFTADGLAWAWGYPRDADLHQFSVYNPPTQFSSWENLPFSPVGASWSEVEAMAAKGGEA